ncbi:LysR family transcriptional regulator [Bacillus sp. FJAT-42376]|uniref:LysR family transcriptional regulator n=1 Tax=Bacillus sp. FJAT-42376 TaxID=2014076 RepID=UPI000F5008A6|nr:LysR family transcriptional regulator [Bacillus sp. FJAT-42376]AZB41040.1 LysR family transcriptional regulator [Bacillus sp. FJAT-42376]
MYYDALKTFVTLAEIKNFTKTAEELHISQPSVSLHIKNLEKELQTKLFIRSPKSLKITPTGEILYSRAKQMIHMYDQTKQDILEHHHDVKGKLTIGASFTIGEYILPAFLVDFQKQYPNLDLEILIGNTEEIVHSVRLFKVDIGLIEGQTNEKELTVEPFMEDELFIVASPAHPLSGKKKTKITDLHSETWVTREIGSGTREYLEHVIRSNGLKVQSFLTISSSQGIKETIISGMEALSLLSYHVIERDIHNKVLSIIPIKDHNFKRKLSMVSSPAMESKMNVEAFMEALRNWRKSRNGR